MKHEELKQAAVECLAKAFKGEQVPAHVVQAATAIVLTPPREMNLELAIEYIGPDELVEVTPKNIRLRKRELAPLVRKRLKRQN